VIDDKELAWPFGGLEIQAELLHGDVCCVKVYGWWWGRRGVAYCVQAAGAVEEFAIFGGHIQMHIKPSRNAGLVLDLPV
jgi:hypothetical protein